MLLFKKKDWNGEVMFLRGAKTVSNLGSPDYGGQRGMGDSVSSARIRPFTLRLNVTIVLDDGGVLPGTLWASRAEVRAGVATIIGMANDSFDRQRALLCLSLGHLTFREDPKRYVMAKRQQGSIPAAWKEARHVDMVFPHRTEGNLGRGRFPWKGKYCLVQADRSSIDKIARTFVHEIGHFHGLEHSSKSTNIMATSGKGKHIRSSLLTDAQIQEIHQKLARNITRQGNRFE